MTLWWFGVVAALAKKPKPPELPPLLEGTVAGEPWAGVRALATGDPNQPGLLVIALSDRDVGCGEVPPDDATLVVLGFEPVVGSPPRGAALVLNKKRNLIRFVQAKGALTALPSAVGERGTVRLDTATAEGTSLTGEVVFEACELVAPMPPPTSAFEERELVVSADPDAPKVRVAVPVAWAQGFDQLGSAEFVAPDRSTRFGLSHTCGGACDPTRFEQNAAEWAESQVAGFRAEPTYTVAIDRDESVAPGVRVVRVTLGSAWSVTTTTVTVLKWWPDRPEMLTCGLVTRAENTALLDLAESACLTLTPVSP